MYNKRENFKIKFKIQVPVRGSALKKLISISEKSFSAFKSLSSFQLFTFYSTINCYFIIIQIFIQFSTFHSTSDVEVLNVFSGIRQTL